MAARPTAKELLHREGALLSTSHLRELGLGRRAIEAVLRACPLVYLPGYSRPLIRAEDYRELVENSTYRGDRTPLPAKSAGASPVGRPEEAAETTSVRTQSPTYQGGQRS